MVQMKVSQRHHTTLLLAILISLLLASMPALGVDPNRRLRAGEKINAREKGEQVMMAQQRVGRVGSAPPTCRSKCGPCEPCEPVHISIKPGLCTPLEYYPEAWRCKCADKLFVP